MKTLTSSQMAKAFPLGYPLKWTIITQVFGDNASYYTPLGLDGHDGLDLRARTPKKCFATCDGVVVWAGADNGGGKGVKIETEIKTVNGVDVKLRILSYHLSKVKVKAGQKVKKGQLIGYTGNTGKYTTAPHLHLAIRPYYLHRGKWEADWDNGHKGRVDPFPFLPGEHYPVDGFYDKKRNWILEYTFRFANTPVGVLVTPFLKKRIEAAQYVHRRLQDEIKEGRRTLPYLSDRENNAVIYGAWELDTVLEPSMFETWSQMTKEEFNEKLGK